MSQEWQDLMRKLPDMVFLELMNNYLGGVSTPYNKERLLAQLRQRLGTEESLQRQMALLSSRDLELLSAIHFFKRSDQRSLAPLEERKGQLALDLMNLEERLLIFATPQGYRISPLLLPRLEAHLSLGRLFSYREADTQGLGGIPPLNGPLLTCLFSILLGEKEMTKGDGTIRKRLLGQMEVLLPHLLGSEGGEKSFLALMEAP